MKNYSLKIYNDTNPENPWKDTDWLAPLFTEWSREYSEQSYNLNVSILIDLLPIGKLNKNILALFNLDEKENYPYTREDYNKKSDFIIDSLREHVENTIENIETLASFLKLDYYSWNSTGYSQGDRINCILVMTPEHIKTTGINAKDKEKIQEDLKSQSKLFDAYAWWDVYGYQCIETIPLFHDDKTLSTEVEENIIDSCYWFYGDAWLAQIKESIPEEFKNLFDDAKANIIYPKY